MLDAFRYLLYQHNRRVPSVLMIFILAALKHKRIWELWQACTACAIGNGFFTGWLSSWWLRSDSDYNEHLCMYINDFIFAPQT